MIVKILNSASKDFHGVKYNDKKINAEKGELMLMKNFPSFINKESSQEEVRNYFKAISKTDKIQKPQFHAVISTKFQEHSKEELTDIAEDFMQEMGYENQPYIVVFHKDTENNHIHIVSTRVSKETDKKLNDSFEKLKSQRVLSGIMEKRYGIKTQAVLEELLGYKMENIQQLKLLLERYGFKISENQNNPNIISILRNGIVEKNLDTKTFSFEENARNDKRKYQIRAFLEKYKEKYSNKVFKVIDNREEKGLFSRKKYEEAEKKEPKISFECELQEQMRKKFGIDIVFHFKEDKNPFGYTLIDNASGRIYKGSEILKMKDLFEFTEHSIEKKEFEQIKDFSIRNENEKAVLQDFFQSKGISVEKFMLFENKKGKKENTDFQLVKNDVKDYLQQAHKTDFVKLQRDENGEWYAIHSRYHQIYKLEYVLGKQAYDKFVNNEKPAETPFKTDFTNSDDIKISAVFNTLDDFGKILAKSAYVGNDPTENELKKRKRKKR